MIKNRLQLTVTFLKHLEFGDRDRTKLRLDRKVFTKLQFFVQGRKFWICFMEVSEVFVLEFNEFIELLANIKSIWIRFYIDIIECKYYLANKTGLQDQEDFSKYYIR